MSTLATRAWLLLGAVFALVLTSFLAEPVPSSVECSGPCGFASVAVTEEAPTVDVSVALQLSAPVALATVESEAPPLPTTAAGSPVATVPEKCIVGVVAEAELRGPASVAFDALNALMPEMRLVLADTGPITISHGGEWPLEQPPLGWTDPTRRTILINPDHPASTIDAALADMIVHELGHVLISTAHVSDGTILDPRLDGQIKVGTADREALGALSCAALGL